MLRYIQGTKLLGITYTRHPSGTLDIQVYSDSNYTGDLEREGLQLATLYTWQEALLYGNQIARRP